MAYPNNGFYAQNTGYPAYPQQPRYEQQYVPFQQTAQPGFICRPVTSREEAVAVPADFTAAGTVMPDLGHGMIYLKRFNPNTGLSDWAEFTLVTPNEAAPTDYTDTLRGFGEQLTGLATRLDEMSEKLEQWRPKTKKGSGEE